MRIVIAGAGSVGRYLVERLVVEGFDVVLVDQDAKILEPLADMYDIQAIVGNASEVQTLRRAGADTASIFLAVTDSDETNLLSCLLVEGLNTDVRTIARVRSIDMVDDSLPETVSGRIDQFINPDLEAVNSLLALIDVPGAGEMLSFAGGRVRVLGLSLLAKSPLVGKALKDLPQLGRAKHLLIVAIARDGQMIIPRGDNELLEGDTVYVATQPDSVNEVLEIFEVNSEPITRVMIQGAGRIGRLVARALVDRSIKVTMIESDPELAEDAAAEVHGALMLQGNATDQGLLRHEGVEDTDLFIAAGERDEDNILSAILAKRMGARFGAVIVRKTSYLGLVPALGIDIVINPRITAASSILGHLRGGTVTSVFSTRDDSAEVLEVVADDNSPLVGNELRQTKWPAGVIVAAMFTEDRVVIPRGDSVIKSGDHLVIFANRDSLKKLEKLLGIKFSKLG